MKALVENVKDRLPHVAGIVSNLDGIKALGKESWLEKQRARYSCPECGYELSWYQAGCPICRGD
jgi:rubrerythrin